MANLVTEIYVSVLGEEFIKLDLHKDESVVMKYTTKDLQDISKVFAPYGQSFTFPATEKNIKALGYFGYTQVDKLNSENKYFCKAYTKGNLSYKGFLTVTSLKYKKNKPTDFTASFTTTMTNLKDRIGDDDLTSLASLEVVWNDATVYDMLSSVKNEVVDSVNVKYFVPLASNIRVLSADNTFPSGLLDNVAYDASVSPSSFGVVTANELRPAVNFKSIMDIIRKKYNLDITIPIENNTEYQDAYIFGNNEKSYSNEFKKITIKNNLGARYFYDDLNESLIPDPKRFSVTSSTVDSSFKITKDDSAISYYSPFCFFRIRFDNISSAIASGSPINVNFKVIRKGTGQLLFTKTASIVGTTLDTEFMFGADELVSTDTEFFIYAQFSQPTQWSNCFFSFRNTFFYRPIGSVVVKATYAWKSDINDNILDLGANKIDLFKSLPKTKVVDFLSSFFKSFNIGIFDSSPNNERLFWLTPNDINTEDEVYSKIELDYTPYVNMSNVTKSTSSDYNYYNFQHAKSKYKSNVDYLSSFGLEYGQTVYPLIKPSSPKEYKIQTGFSIVPPVSVFGSEIKSFYAFNNDTPTILTGGEARYKPNFGELTIFYSHGITSITNPIGVRSINLSNVIINKPLSQYIKVMPFDLNGHSLAFSVLVDSSVEYPINLFSEYYDEQIARLLDPNVLTHEFTLTLPPDEIYLNEATTYHNNGKTPVGFRLQNEIIIGENRFTILEAEIDITTGKTPMKLLNIK